MTLQIKKEQNLEKKKINKPFFMRKRTFKINESIFSPATNRYSWVPFFGFIFFLVFAPITLFEFSRGKHGFHYLRRGFIKTIIFSVIPISLFVLWAGLPEEYYPDMIFKKHGVYENISVYPPQTEYYFFGEKKREILRYDKKHIRFISNFKNGKYHGLCEKFYIDGMKKSTQNYQNGLMEGYQAVWYEGGSHELEAYYNNFKCSGTWKGFYKYGKKFWELSFDRNGKRTGLYKVWHENGNLAVEGRYENGVEIGKWTCYKEDGSIDWQTDDYQKGFDRTFNSKNELYIGFQENDSDYYENKFKTPSDEDIALPNDKNWQITIKNINSDLESFKNVLNEMRRKHIPFFTTGWNRWGDHGGGPYFESFIDNYSTYLLACAPMKNLSLSETNVTDSNLGFLKSISLNEIDLSGCHNISDEGLMNLKDMQIHKLKLSGCNITNEGLRHLKSLPIKHLNFSNTNISSDGLVHIQDMPIENLDLSRCDLVTDKGLAFLSRMPLKTLSLSFSNINGIGLISLYGVPIKTLYLQGLDIDDNDLSYLNSLPLEELYLSECPNLTSKGFKHLEGLPLKKLFIQDCYFYNFDSLNKIPLDYLYLSMNPNIDDKGLSNLKNLPIRDLDFDNCPKITNNWIKSVKGIKLDSIRLYELEMTDEIIEIIKVMPLEHLVFYECTNVNDNTLYKLKDLKLKELVLSGSNISEIGLLHLEKMPLEKLEFKNVNSNLNLSNDYSVEYGFESEYYNHDTTKTIIKNIINRIKKFNLPLECKNCIDDNYTKNLYTKYIDSGDPTYTGYYKNDKYVGKWYDYYKPDVKKWETEFDHDGFRVGKYTVWHENGMVAIEGQFENDEEVGKWTCYNEDGTIDWQTDAYQKGFERKFNSKQKFIVELKNQNGIYEYLGTTPSEKDLIIPQNKEWRIKFINPSNEKMYDIADEISKKHIQNIYIEVNECNFSLNQFSGLPLKEIYLVKCKELNVSVLMALKGMSLNKLRISDYLGSVFNIPEYLSNISVIELELPNMALLNDDDIEKLKDMKIKYLNLYKCTNLDGEFTKYLSNMPLEKLVLTKTKIDDKGLSHLKNLPIKELHLMDCDYITDSGLLNLKDLPLKELNLWDCNKISPEYKDLYKTSEEIKIMFEKLSKKIKSQKQPAPAKSSEVINTNDIK